jgi:UDP-N-acetylmuramate--alanine ligase
MPARPIDYVDALPSLPGPVHFVGIGGIGMSALARILYAWGYHVTGSDAVLSDVTQGLEAEGIPVQIGHKAVAEAASAALVVVTAAVRGDNQELGAAMASKVPVVKRAQLLGMLANERTCVAVAGTHGKSTTSGMIASALVALGADPTYAIGAVLASTGTNAAPGDGEVMVVEADEYDYSFLTLHSDIAVVTNIEYDHPDLFPDQARYDDAFARFVSQIRPGGSLVIAGDDPGCQQLLNRLQDSTFRVQRFAQTEDAAWQLRGSEGSWTVRDPSGEQHPLRVKVPGLHNARNTVAAVAAISSLGFSPAEAAAALGSYQGVGRRFETKGEANGVLVIDDYAHHPSEIEVTLRAARGRFTEKRIWAVFQPHTFSRTKALLNEFAGSFGDADKIVILDIYPSRETDSLGISAAHLIRLLPNGAMAGGSPAEAVELLSDQVEGGDVVLTLGAGDVTSIGPKLLDRLRAREQGA